MRFMNKSHAKPHLFAHTRCVWSNIYVGGGGVLSGCFLAEITSLCSGVPRLSLNPVAKTLENFVMLHLKRVFFKGGIVILTSLTYETVNCGLIKLFVMIN